jgi:DNA invertase Pin-like site-specific DNA recombinase
MDYPDAIMHADIGYSGSDRTRPSLHQMTGFLNITTRKPKLIIVETIDRLYRDNTGFLLFIEKYVMQNHVHLWFPSQSIFLCKENAMEEGPRTLYTLLGAMAENELTRISKRTKQSLAAKKAKGHYFQGLSAWKSAKKLKVTIGKVQRARKALGLN